LHPVHVFDAGVLTSPAVCQLLQYSTDYDCGIIISASHNSYQDNGIKLVDAHTGKVSATDEQLICQLLEEQKNYTPDYSMLGKHTLVTDAAAQYQRYLTPFFEPNFLSGTKIVLDCAHGAAFQLAPQIFEQFGAEVIALHNKPNGLNINKQCGALSPQEAQNAVIKHNAAIGFAFDGDGDRVLAITKHGHLKTGDDILALLMAHPAYQHDTAIAGTIMSNMGFEEYLSKKNKKLHRTQVGDKYVVQAMVQHNLSLGGEPSGHIITRDYLNTGDGVFCALRLLQVIQASGNWELTTFAKYPQIIINLPVAQKITLDTEPLASLIDQSKSQLSDGRMIVRYSGTEPLLRIMIEDVRFEHAQAVGAQLAQQLKKTLSA